MPNFAYRVHDGLADWLGGVNFPAAPTSLHAGLLTAAPEPDGTGVFEPLQGGYARQAVVFDKAQLDGVTTLTNSAPLVFGSAISEWTPVTYFGLFDENDNLVLYGRLRTTRACPAGESITFAAGAIAIGLR